MGRMFQLSEARKNLSELVNKAYYEGKLFGISKGKKPMGVLIGAKAWKGDNALSIHGKRAKMKIHGRNVCGLTQLFQGNFDPRSDILLQ